MRLVHLIVVAVPVPQIQEQIVEAIKVFPQEQMAARIVEQVCGCACAADPGTDR